MAFSVQQIDQKISEAQDALKYWTELRVLVSDPRFGTLQGKIEAVKEAPPATTPPATSNDTSKRAPYGLLKKMILEHLPRNGGGITPQQLANLVKEKGYNFITQTPSISVNDTLQGLAKTGNAKILEKKGLSNLWVRIGDAD